MISFYEVVTGDRLAFKKLCTVLPVVINDVVQDMERRTKGNTVFEELNELSSDLLTSVFLLSFKTYEGFDDLKIKKA